MKRREFLTAAAAFSTARLLADKADLDDSLLMLTADETARIRKVQPAALKPLRALAEQEMHKGPWSITFHRPEHTRLDAHDYFSEGPYWWPNPRS